MKLQLARGVRDFPPVEQIVRQRIADAIKSQFERYGFLPLDTPVIERFDVLASKYAGGAEILKETFQLTDQGKRELCLRYDLTVPMCRFVGMNPNVKLPFKRYQMGPVFRDGPIKLGRYREFWQVDADIVGTKDMMAEAELITMAFDTFEDIGLPVRMEINSRKILDAIMKTANVPQNKMEDFILSVDKLKKIGVEKVKKELLDKEFSLEQIDKALEYLTITGTAEEKLKVLSGIMGEELEEMRQLLNILNQTKPGNYEFTPSLARGLSYYTGTVFEVFLVDSEITSSCAAGGRYDKMISDFLQSKQEYPAIGISFGLEIINDALRLKGGQKGQSIAKVFVVPIGTRNECVKIAAQLRKAGINTDLDITGRGLSKLMKYANSLLIPYTIIIGEDELKEGVVLLRDMDSGEQKKLTVKEVIKFLS